MSSPLLVSQTVRIGHHPDGALAQLALAEQHPMALVGLPAVTRALARSIIVQLLESMDVACAPPTRAPIVVHARDPDAWSAFRDPRVDIRPDAFDDVDPDDEADPRVTAASAVDLIDIHGAGSLVLVENAAEVATAASAVVMSRVPNATMTVSRGLVTTTAPVRCELLTVAEAVERMRCATGEASSPDAAIAEASARPAPGRPAPGRPAPGRTVPRPTPPEQTISEPRSCRDESPRLRHLLLVCDRATASLSAVDGARALWGVSRRSVATVSADIGDHEGGSGEAHLWSGLEKIRRAIDHGSADAGAHPAPPPDSIGLDRLDLLIVRAVRRADRDGLVGLLAAMLDDAGAAGIRVIASAREIEGLPPEWLAQFTVRRVRENPIEARTLTTDGRGPPGESSGF
jgi:hypothetical protein